MTHIQAPASQPVKGTLDRLFYNHVTFALLSLLYLTLIVGVPLLVPLLIARTLPQGGWSLSAAILLTPLAYALGYPLLAGLLSRAHRRSVLPGTFPRDVGTRLYFHRRLYNLCWTTLYYCTPVYHVALSLPVLKRMVFRLFGYRGTPNFTTYPDTWIRDLPLLRLGDGAYLSNKATVGTNVVLRDGTILVGGVDIGKRALVGHLSIIAPGTVIGDDVEIGIGVLMGLKVRVEQGAVVSGFCGLGHGVVVGARSVIGGGTVVGHATRIGPDLVIPPGMSIPSRVRLTCQEDVAAYCAPYQGPRERARLVVTPAAVASAERLEFSLAEDPQGVEALVSP